MTVAPQLKSAEKECVFNTCRENTGKGRNSNFVGFAKLLDVLIKTHGGRGLSLPPKLNKLYRKLLKIFGYSNTMYYVKMYFGGNQWKDIFRQERLRISGRSLSEEFINIAQLEEYPELSDSDARGQFPQTPTSQPIPGKAQKANRKRYNKEKNYGRRNFQKEKFG